MSLPEAAFAALSAPTLVEEAINAAAEAWRTTNLMLRARARIALIAAGRTRKADEVTVTCPDSVAKLAPGPSSDISEAVV